MMQKEGMDVKETEEEKGDKEEWSFSTYPLLKINCYLKLFFSEILREYISIST